MKERVLCYRFWHAYGEKCLSLAQIMAVRKEPAGRLIRLVYWFRLRIALGLAREALRAFHYANHFIA